MQLDPSIERIVAFETSCDDTSVAVVAADGAVEAVCSANQDLAHGPFGGIVPELASRNHTIAILPLLEEALSRSKRTWSEIQGLAVTSRPGLVGSLMVGIVTAKTLALAKKLPLIGVNHIEGHILAPFLRDAQHAPPPNFAFPYLALVISGGHTHIFSVRGVGQIQLIGKTLDDAAGEAFDKFAKMAGLGYPGGAEVDREARAGDVKAYPFPRGMIKEDHLNFSFSGLKTAAQRVIQPLSTEDLKAARPDLCASYQEAIVDVLLAKLDRAIAATGIRRVVLTGGVSANSRLRERAQAWAAASQYQLVVPPARYCTDNAAMIGYAGVCRLRRGERSAQDLGPSPAAWTADYQEA